VSSAKSHAFKERQQMIRVAPLVLAAALLAAPAVLAQEAIPTAAAASPSGAPLPAGPPPPLSAATRDPRADAGPIYGPCGPLRRKADGSIAPASQQAHGEVGASVGSNGYREAGGVVCQPIGDNAAVTLGVDVGRYGRGR
jgi:hypothetical protein